MLTGLALLPLLFAEATDRFDSQPCSGDRAGCYSNYVVLVDLDGDGDLDVVFASGGGYYEADVADPMAVYLNDGDGHMTEVNTTIFGGFTGRLRQVAVGDIDSDGDMDLVAPDAWAMQPDAVFVNQGGSPPVFAEEGGERLDVSSRAAAARLADLDGDGDLDLVLSDWGDDPFRSPGTAHVYRNDGTGHFAELAGAVPQDTSTIGTGPIDLDLFDADGDFDLDLVLASRSGDSLFFVNDGTGKFGDANARFPAQPGPYVYGPDVCDVDGDRDLDVWLDNGGSDARGEQLLINDGSGTFSDRTADISGDPGADDNEVQCADLDLDGDLDAVVASLDDNERLLRNDGTGKFTTERGVFPTVSDASLGLDLGDLDGDGRLDAVTAQGENGSFLNRLYLGTAEQVVDTRPPSFRAVETELRVRDGKARIRFAVVDRATSDVGPRLREAYIEHANAKHLAHFVGGDLFHAEVPVEGAITYKACATDAAGNAACSEELSFDPALVPDAGPAPEPDAGPVVPIDDSEGSCGCRTTSGVPWDGAWLLLLALLYRRRRAPR